MRNPAKHFEKLKQDYRIIFSDIYSDICFNLKNLSNSECINYLENRLKNTKKELLLSITNNRKECSCQNCGICCRFAISEFSYDELKFKANKGDSFATQFISTFIPYDDSVEYEKIFPQYIDFLKNSGEYYVYHCPKVTTDNKCSDYENRPQICRDFPDNPVAFLAPNCGFTMWKLKSESVWLRLVAETEIINHLLDK